jgi:hypothetical protein
VRESERAREREREMKTRREKNDERDEECIEGFFSFCTIFFFLNSQTGCSIMEVNYEHEVSAQKQDGEIFIVFISQYHS